MPDFDIPEEITSVETMAVDKIYRVLVDAEAEKDGDLRIIDESGEDYLYPKDWFVRITLPDAVGLDIRIYFLTVFSSVFQREADKKQCQREESNHPYQAQNDNCACFPMRHT